MKKTVSLILLICMILTSIPFTGAVSLSAADANVEYVFSSEENASVLGNIGKKVSVLPGDVNDDGEIGMKDVLLLKKIVAGYSVADYNEYAADVNQDGSVNSKDTYELRRCLGLIVPTPDKTTVIVGGEGGAGFDEASQSAEILASDGIANVKIALAEENISAENYPYAVLTYKGADGDDMTVMPAAGTVAEADVTNAFSSQSNDNEKFNVKIVDLRDAQSYSGKINEIAFDIPTEDESVYIDSFAVCPTLENAEAFASERETERNGLGEYDDNGTASFVFSNTEKVTGRVIASNNTRTAYDANEDAMRVTLTGQSDPWVLINMEDLNISADEYKYIAYVYNIPTTLSKRDPMSELFLSAGEISGPTAGCSVQFSVTRDGMYIYQIFDLSTASFWNGKLHNIRFDILFDGGIGDYVLVDSVIFGKDSTSLSVAADAAKTAASARVSSPDEPAGIWDTFNAACVESTLGTGVAYMSRGTENTICFTGGNADLITEENIASRMKDLVLSSTGKNVTVEIIDGFNEIKDEYAVDGLSDSYVTYKLSTKDECFIAREKTQINIRKVIFDQDLGPDCDDSGASAILLKAHKKGEIKLLAITHVCSNQSGAYCIAAMCDYLGITDVAVGTNTDNGKFSGDHNGKCSTVPADTYYATRPRPTLTSNRTLLRTIFANNNKKDILFITAGPLSTLDTLFSSGADAISPKSGRQLFVDNVSTYMCGATNTEGCGDKEFNVVADLTAARNVINSLPSLGITTIFSGSCVADQIGCGQSLEWAPDDWVVKGCYYYQNLGGSYVRMAWDLANVYYAIYGPSGFWWTSGPSTIGINEDGSSYIKSGGNHYYIGQLSGVSDSEIAIVFNRCILPY